MIISFTQRKTELEMDDATSLIQFSRNTPVSVCLSDNTYLSNTDIPHPNYRYALTWQDKNRINVAKTDLEYDKETELYYGKIGKAATIFSGLTYVSLAAIDVDSGITLTTHSAEVYILRSIDPESAFIDDPASLSDIIDKAVDKWITANGVTTGATAEQVEQIEQNTQAISSLSEESVRYKRILTAVDDLNDVTDSGIYVFNTGDVPANAPFGNLSNVTVFAADYNADLRYVVQIVQRTGTNNDQYIAIRNRNDDASGGSWSPWYYPVMASSRHPTDSAVHCVTSALTDTAVVADWDDVTCNIIYTVADDAGIANSPIFDYAYNMIVINGRTSSAIQTGALQIAVECQTGRVLMRGYSAGAWTDWRSNSLQYMVESAALMQYENLLANISENVALAASMNWTDHPGNEAGVFTSMNYSPNYNLQTYTGMLSGMVWTRIVNRNTHKIYRDWQNDISQAPMEILALGDSICRGYRNGQKGFVGDLHLPYTNIGVSSATISTVTTSVTNIPMQLSNHHKNNPDYYPDVIISDGGINDYICNAPMGDIPTAPITTDEEASTLDKSTVMGGLQYLLYQMITLYPNAQRFFLLAHKMYYVNGGYYCPTHKNGQGYTQEDIFNAIGACCEVYSTKLIDIYGESFLDSAFPAYRSATNYTGDNIGDTAAETAMINYDGIHPLPAGYLHGYIPIVRQALRLGTANN